jgi:hypothetical protein
MSKDVYFLQFHSILCNKSDIMGIESGWFKSYMYLTGRSQVVRCGNKISNHKEIECGVSQGSILGPLLFIVYVNDMSTSVDDDCKLILYADDSGILY